MDADEVYRAGAVVKSPPRVVQLPGGVKLQGIRFKILDHHDDGSPKTFEILPRNDQEPRNDPSICVLFADETWIRGRVKS